MIAHRLETAATYSDKVLVMDQGNVAEFDHAFKLLVKDESDVDITADTIFASMVKALAPYQ